MTPEQQALIERATHLDKSATPGPWDAWEEEITAGDDLLFQIGPRSRATAHDTLFATQARSLVPALAAALKQVAEENAKLMAQLNLAHAAYDLLTSDSDALRERLAKCEAATRG
jgi:hypothetical protein